MFQNQKVRWAVIWTTLAIAIYWYLPNVLDSKKIGFLPESKIVRGLDIQGGIHLVLGVDVKNFMSEKIERLSRTIKEDLTKAGVDGAEVTYSATPKPSFVIKTSNGSALDQAKAHINKTYPATFQILNSSGSEAQFAYFDNVEREQKERVVGQSIEVIRNRIDSFGTLEPNIAAQGSDRILVQLPGIEDSEKAKQLLNTTAKLEFMIISNEIDSGRLETWVNEVEAAGNYTLGVTNENGLEYVDYVRRINADLADRLPENTEIVFEMLPNVSSLTEGRVPRLAKNDQIVTGDMVEDAYVGRDGQAGGRPVVLFSMSVEGRRPFGEITGNNINQPLGIVLDKVLKSAPNVSSRITDSGQISLGTGNTDEVFEEAQFVSRTLRAGALPASLQQLEERTVGPSLGSDFIKKGSIAGIIGCIGIVIFMIAYYGFFGVIASACLLMNVLLLLSILSTLGATLTLPGIAGIVLTMGMAVDANIIIFERIKEELRKGTGLNAAIKDGFSNALSAILDSNITTAIVCLVLLNYGTGPIKGFAVTLICGVVTSVYTAVFVSRTVIDFMVQKLKIQKVMRY